MESNRGSCDEAVREVRAGGTPALQASPRGGPDSEVDWVSP